MDHDLAEEYEIDLGEEFASLQRVGDEEVRTDPNLSYGDEPYADIYQDAVYGGRADPEATQHFFVYEVDWEGEEQPAASEELGEELDSVFAGWIINDEGERVFALRERNRSSEQ